MLNHLKIFNEDPVSWMEIRDGLRERMLNKDKGHFVLYPVWSRVWTASPTYALSWATLAEPHLAEPHCVRSVVQLNAYVVAN